MRLPPPPNAVGKDTSYTRNTENPTVETQSRAGSHLHLSVEQHQDKYIPFTVGVLRSNLLPTLAGDAFIISRSAAITYHCAYVRQTQVNWKKRNKKKKRRKKKGKKRKESEKQKKRKDMKSKKRIYKKKQGKETR